MQLFSMYGEGHRISMMMDNGAGDSILCQHGHAPAREATPHAGGVFSSE